MRTRFFADLLTAARSDPNLVLITGDLGFGVVEPFVEACPAQFVNAGVAEQNMTGMAAGMAMAGAKVFTYSIANFPTMRCLEQIRNDVAYHGADVVIVGVGGGLAYGALGMSHHATEDIAVMRAIPGLAVVAPGDPEETGAVLMDLIERGGPAYLRLGKAGERSVHASRPDVARGQAVTLRNGTDVALVSTGAMLPVVVDAADDLDQLGISSTVVSSPWIAPFDESTVRRLASTHRLMVTVEEHSITGGLGGAAAEVLAESGSACPLMRIGVSHKFNSVVGDQGYLREVHGLTRQSISKRVVKRLEDI
ncbi:transketolase family protein [Nocardioides aquiterrae]|uniref:Transketolase C-terminal domain-containing protein n=1 Tax=Nocardioides aquiterrae TaxID=203799 RepID=A0ABN1UEY5_9ACTN